MKSGPLFGAGCVLAVVLGTGIGLLRPITGSGQTVGPDSASTPGCTANSIFLSIPSLKALTADNTALQVQDFSVGAENPVTIGSTTSLSGAGKAVPTAVTIARPVDVHSIALFHDLVLGENLGPVTIELRGVDSAGKTALCDSFGLSGRVQVTSQAHQSSDEGPKETLSIAFSRLSFSAGGVASQWDFVSNTTAARVSTFTARHTGGHTAFQWRLLNASGVAGFNLYSGQHRLNAHLIPVHRSPIYRYGTSAGSSNAVLHVVLTRGAEILVPAAR